MQEITLGKTGLHVSRIAFGTWQLGGDWGSTDEAAAIAAIRRAADSGINLFDTAQGYGFGASERLLAAALRGLRRDEFVVATKGGLRPKPDGGITRDGSPEWIRAGVESSLRALRTDYIDIYQVHWPDPATPFADTADELAKLVADGKIGHVGVSNFDEQQMEEFSGTVPVETLQPPYHLFRRDIEPAILPYTAVHDIGVLVYGPLAHGLLTGRMRPGTVFAPDDWRSKNAMFAGDIYARNLEVVSRLERFAHQQLGTSVSKLAVAWTLAHPGVHVAIIGTRNASHIAEGIEAADLTLDQATLSRINEIMKPAIPVSGPSPERA